MSKCVRVWRFLPLRASTVLDWTVLDADAIFLNEQKCEVGTFPRGLDQYSSAMPLQALLVRVPLVL